MHAAFDSSRVTSSKWWRSMSGMIVAACFFSVGVPLFLRTPSVIESSERRPIVRPDMRPVGTTPNQKLSKGQVET